MYHCPYCGFDKISINEKVKASALSPYACPNCNQLSYTKTPWIEILFTWFTWPLAIIGLLIISFDPLWGTASILILFFGFMLLSTRARKKSALSPISSKKVLISRVIHYSLISFLIIGGICGLYLSK